MKHKTAMNEFQLVFRLFKKRIMKLGPDGYFAADGYARGVLVKRIHMGEVWYHRPEDYLDWKKHLGNNLET